MEGAKTVTMDGKITFVLIEGDASATAEQLAQMVPVIAVGVGFYVDGDPDKAPGAWAIQGAVVDPTTAVIGTVADPGIFTGIAPVPDTPEGV